MSGGGGGFNPVSTASKGVGSFVGDITGANRMADAQGAAADAQLKQQQEDRTLGQTMAGPSEMEMQQLQQAITLNQQDISRKQKILDSSDPALIEAGHQALALMQGKSAAALGPIQKQREQDRQNLESTLSQHLGADYATSSAGIQALNNFDMQTNALMTNAQQQTLSQFLGVSQNMQQFGSQQPNIGNSSALAGQRGAINQRQINTMLGTPMNPGLGFAGDISRAQGNYFMGIPGLINGVVAPLKGIFSGGGSSSGIQNGPQQVGGAAAPTGG